MSWKKVKLGDCCFKIGSGATPKGGAKVYISDGVAFIRSQNVYNLSFNYNGLAHITDQAAEKLKGVTVQPNDVLINITGDSVARTCIVPNDVLPARVNQHVAIIRPNPTILNARFLNYYLSSPYMQSFMLSLSVGKGASRNAMTKDMIANYDIPCPSLDTQCQIAKILSAYDDLIENNQKQIKLLEEAAQRLYKEWFIDLLFPGYEDAEIIGDVPEGWKKDRADSFFQITIGKTPPRAEKQWFLKGDIGIPWLSISDMGKAGVYVFNTNEALTEEAVKKYKMKIVPTGTVFVSFKLTVGRVAIATTDTCTNEAIAHFYIDDDWKQAYTYCYLKNFEYGSLGNTSSISNAVNSKIIKAMPFIMPNDSTILSFSKLVDPILKEVKNKQNTCIKLAEARDLLLLKLMSGELEV